MNTAIGITLLFFCFAVSSASFPMLWAEGQQRAFGCLGLVVAAWCAVAGAWMFGFLR